MGGSAADELTALAHEWDRAMVAKLSQSPGLPPVPRAQLICFPSLSAGTIRKRNFCSTSWRTV